MKKLALFVIIATAYSTTANAAHIKEPEVNKGEWEIHNTTILENDSEDAFENELEISYGINDWLEAEVAVGSADHEDESFDYFSGAEFAAKFKLTDEGQYRPATALYLSYEYTDEKSEADEIAIMGIFGKNIGKFENIINLQLANQIGGAAEGGVELALNARSVYEICEDLSLGAEYYGNFGEVGAGHGWNEQGHQIGPVVMFEPIEHMHASLAYLAGISDDAPESAIKLEVGYHF